MGAPARSLAAVLGGSKELAIFESLALRKGEPLSATDICRFSGVAWATTHRRLNDWEARGVVTAADRDGKAQKYLLNLGSPAVRALSHAVTLAVLELLDSDLSREGVNEGELLPRLPWVEVTDSSLESLKWLTPSMPAVSGDKGLLAALAC
jgi:hypothetical protein